MRPLSPVGPGIELTGTERAAQLSTFQPLSPSESKTYCLKYSASLACWDWLASHGCDEAQGYLMGRPMPLEDLEASLGTRSAPTPSASRVSKQAARQAAPV